MYDVILGDRPKSVNKSYPCPFCDHADWCYMTKPDKPVMPDGSDGLLFHCMRIGGVEYGETITGNDGDTYVCVGKTKGGATVLEQMSQYIKRHPNSKKAAELGGGYSTRAQVVKKEPLKIEPEIQPRSSKELNKAYQTMISMLRLEDEDREKLHKDGMTDEVIAFNMLVTLPENDGYRFKNKGKYKSINPCRKDVGEKIRQVMGGSIEGIPGLYYNSAGKATIAGAGGILYPQFDIDGNIVAMRIGVKKRWKDDKGNYITKEEYEHATAEAKAIGEKTNYVQLGKYMNLSSYSEDTDALKQRIIRNRFQGGCRSGNHLGIYKAPGKPDLSIVFITEGEKKAMIAAKYLNKVVIDVPGVSSHSLLYQESDSASPLRRLMGIGTKAVVVAYDADKLINQAVLNAETDLLAALEEMGLGICVAEWDPERGKGLDDILVAGGKISYDVRKQYNPAQKEKFFSQFN